MKMFAGILLLILGAFAVGTSAFVDCDNPGSIESFPSDLLKKVPLKSPIPHDPSSWVQSLSKNCPTKSYDCEKYQFRTCPQSSGCKYLPSQASCVLCSRYGCRPYTLAVYQYPPVAKPITTTACKYPGAKCRYREHCKYTCQHNMVKMTGYIWVIAQTNPYQIYYGYCGYCVPKGCNCESN